MPKKALAVLGRFSRTGVGVSAVRGGATPTRRSGAEITRRYKTVAPTPFVTAFVKGFGCRGVATCPRAV